MGAVERGVCCPGCPHRAAYVACREALGRGRGRAVVGDAGCAAVGAMHPAATTCPGGEDALHPRYKLEPSCGPTPAEPALEQCIHMIPDTALADRAPSGDQLAREGAVTILAVLASSASNLTREAVEETAARALALGAEDAMIVDPFDSQRCANVLAAALARPGVHAVVFASPCARLTLRHPLEPAEIDAYACMACHRCHQITGCPAIGLEPPVFRIDPEHCAGCDLCVEYCRTHIIYSPRSRMTPEERSRERYLASLS